MKRKHEMPFGAECLDDDTVRFRLCAPKASSVSVELSDLERSLPMSRLDEGWFELVTQASAGAHYGFKIDDQQVVPDPASRFQPLGVHGTSEVIDPLAFDWQDSNWRGRPWDEVVIYELHVGTFSPQGTFAGAEDKLDYLADLGVTAVELMPLASFPGERNWGYDGVLPYAPARCYGMPEELKHFVDTAHAKNLMVFVDVVYNHFGPEGNYLGLYAPQFFTDRHRTPWGQAINFDGPCSRTVRDFFIHNALYWLEEYHFDGLRFDAVHAIADDSRPDILTELADTVRTKFGAEHHVHLVLENDNNSAHYLCREARVGSSCYNAQWNDDIHHALHVLVTGEKDGYYSDYAKNPAWHLGRCLAEGFSYQGEGSAFRDGAKRGEPSRDLPSTCFVSFLQNHDQVGNRALGERITQLADAKALRLAMAILLLAPSPPLLFMGEEFGATTPFLFFCDFGPELASKVTEGRRSEFARFEQFNSPQAQQQIPDPNSKETFLRSKLDWESLKQEPHRNWLHFYRTLLTCRREKIVPLIKDIAPGRAKFEVLAPYALDVQWPLSKSGSLQLIANFGATALALRNRPDGALLYTTVEEHDPAWKEIPPLAAAWFLNA
ncbi:MAG: 1,4-alpha-glucan branching protein [Acidobacteriaceae bacterium]|nr:1,4-alpha-glucan branching protein [Acidobacteriaceae bacterium]